MDRSERIAMIRDAVSRRENGLVKKTTGLLAFVCFECGAEEIEKREKRFSRMVCRLCRYAMTKQFFSWQDVIDTVGSTSVKRIHRAPEQDCVFFDGVSLETRRTEKQETLDAALRGLGRLLYESGVCVIDKTMCKTSRHGDRYARSLSARCGTEAGNDDGRTSGVDQMRAVQGSVATGQDGNQARVPAVR